MTGPHGIVGVDLDHCVSNDTIAPWAQEVVDQLASYTELSPSGSGLRILCSGELASDWTNHDRGIEVYGGNEARFLTVTGQRLLQSVHAVTSPQSSALVTLEARYAKERRRAEVIELNMPEVIDEVLLPSFEKLDIPYSARDFLETGTHRGDRSRELFAAAVALYSSGLPDDEVFSLLVQNQYAMETALDHRRQDHDRALQYMWREHCCKGKAKATPRMSVNEFDDVSPPMTPTKNMRFQLLPPSKFMSGKPLSWLIKGVLPRAELCIIFGDSGSGKSFITLDLVAAISRGVDWRGKKVKQGRVAYICAEAPAAFKVRMEAYAHHHKIDIDEMQIGLTDEIPDLLNKTDIKDFIASMSAFGKLDVLVIDTFARAFQGNENSGEDVSLVVSRTHVEQLFGVTSAVRAKREIEPNFDDI